MVNHCPICDKPKEASQTVCEKCSEGLDSECFDSFMARCPVCHWPKSSSMYECPNCREHKGHRVYPVARYDGKLGYSVVYSFKFQGKRQLSRVAAQWLSKAIDVLDPEGEALIVPVPCSDSRMRKYGWDPMIEVCRCLERQFVPLISNTGKQTQQQKTLGRAERSASSMGKFRISENYLDSLNEYKERKLIVVDDVSTTGTTIARAIELLENNGFSDVSGAVWLCAYLPTGGMHGL